MLATLKTKCVIDCVLSVYYEQENYQTIFIL